MIQNIEQKTMNNHFLEKCLSQHKKDSFVGDIKENFDNINSERLIIGQKIQEYIIQGLKKKEILEVLSKETFLPVSSIRNMIEEYTFNEDYKEGLNGKKLSINEIKLIKKIFLEKNITENKKNDFLSKTNISEILVSEREKVENNDKEYSHTFSLNSEGETLFTQLKKMIENQEKRKISNGEFVLMALMELYSSYPFEELGDNIISEELES